MTAVLPSRQFRLAPMSSSVLVTTVVALALPLVAAVLKGGVSGLAVGGLMATVYAVVWLWFRPTRFVVDSESVRVEWPLRVMTISRRDLRRVEVSSVRDSLRGVRVGAGGLWGSFGLLVGSDETIEFYISRRDGLVRIERSSGRPVVITPETPDAFVAAVHHAAS